MMNNRGGFNCQYADEIVFKKVAERWDTTIIIK